MLADFLPHFEGDSQVKQVRMLFNIQKHTPCCLTDTHAHAPQFLHTWHIYLGLTSPHEDRGLDLQTKNRAEVVVRSLMAQFETLAYTRNPKFIKRCCVSYGKLLLVPTGMLRVVFMRLFLIL